jgi:hypothetical protein
MTTSLLPLVKLLFQDNNPGVTKLKNTQYDSVYVCECKSMLRKERHYMFVIGSVDVIPIGSNVQIEDINNISCIQFRTFQEPIVQQVLLNYIDFDARAGQIPIKRYNISKDGNGKKISEYMFQFENKPYNVHIFHQTDSDYEFVPDGNLLSALITWDTMIMSSINVGAPPSAQEVFEPESPKYTRNSSIPPLPPQRQMVATPDTELQFERRARPQVRAGRNTIYSSQPLPPVQPTYQYPQPPPPSQPLPPQPTTRYPLGPLSQPPPPSLQSAPPPQQQPQQPRPQQPRPPRPQQPRPPRPQQSTRPPKRRVAFKEQE